MSGSVRFFSYDDGGAPRRSGRFIPMMMCGALALAGLTALSTQNTFAGDATATESKGKQPTPWGPPYANMPDFVPPNVRPSEYAAVTDKDVPPVDAAKGYSIEKLGGGLYVVTEGVYQMMIVVSDEGVIILDAPPTIGPKILKALEEVAPGAKIVALIYSHAHVDHIGFASEIVKTNPGMKIVAHEETKKLLARADDPARPLPTVTFDTQDQNFEFKVGNQTLQLQYPGPNHEPGNIGIYHPDQKVLMFVDVIFPGWMMWRRFAASQDIPGYFNAVKTLNSRWDYKVLVAGHMGRRLGTRADVDTQYDFMTDLHKAALEGLMTTKPGKAINPKNANNPWAVFRDYVDLVTNHCVNKVSPKWTTRLAAFDVWIYDQCLAMEQSIRIDGPSIK
jgi:glyoxylase-like metal-dependent hydrolase (beta-lactamase superfamily II)